MFFSIIIPTFNRADILKKALSALYDQSVDQRDYEVIVVNDGSTDHTAKVVKEFSRKYKNLVYVRQKNQGQGVARNTGLKLAKGKVVLFGQDDIIPTRDFLFEHQKFHYLYPEENAAVLGFTAWHPELKITPFMNWLVNGSSVLGRFGGHQFAYEKLYGRKMADFNFFYTSNLSIKKSLLLKHNFDPAFSGYGWEDIELGYRLEQEAALKLYYNSWAVAYHYHYMDESSLPERMKFIGQSAWIFHKKYPTLKKVPGLFKYLIFKSITIDPIIWLFSVIKRYSGGSGTSLYYYLLSKKYFLIGLAKGRKKYAK
jgi:glycosyltransferase involved in cell wall biosynthesis